MSNDKMHQQMKIFDGFSEYVYIADMDTYELYFLNEAAKEKFHVKDYEGKKCYHILQGRTSPCPFCNNDRLRKEDFIIWEMRNEHIKSHGLLKDTIIDWNGKDVRLEIAKDLSNEDMQLQQLTIAHQMEEVTLKCVQKLYEVNDPTEAIDAILRMLGSFLQADRAYIFEIHEDLLFNTYEWCNEGITSEQAMLQGVSMDLIQHWLPSFAKGECYIMEHIDSLKEKYEDTYRILSLQGVECLAAVPIIMKGEFVGCIGVDNPDLCKTQSFPMLDTLGYFFSLSFEKQETQAEMLRRTYIDGLTGVYNRNRYLKDLAFQEGGHNVAHGVVYLDVNDLKGTNDLFGHLQGDRMLVEAASYLKQVFEDNSIYRIGGDEFIVLSQCEDEKELQEQVQKLRNLFMLSNTCSAAIGYIWREKGDITEMVKEADAIMYQDKKEYYQTHLSIHRYRSEHDETMMLQNEDEVKKAVEQRRFHLYLQPKTSMDAKTVIGSEALVRYVNKEGDILPPMEFIPILEQAHTIHIVDFFMFEEACSLIKVWKEKGFQIQPISVNFSRFTLLMDNFIDKLKAIWERYGIDQSLIEIEIVERVEKIDNDFLIHVMNEIKKLGFRVSIDDFGVKYSNLFLFTNTEIDTLKLDRSLILDLAKNTKSQLIIKALSQLCEELDIQLIVEGVETQEQLMILSDLNCDGIQGYLVSKPIPHREFTKRFVE